jgi:positive regulator of sigma E activity
MIEQNVQVLQCSDEQLKVRLGAQAGCTACDSGMGCGAGLFAKLIQRKPVVLELARNDIEVKEGQMLTLAFPEQLYLKLVIASYGWPLLASLAGAFAGHSAAAWVQLSPVLNDVATLLSGVLFAWVSIRLISNRNAAETILNSLTMTVCVPSSTPNMCTGKGKIQNTV